jgi:ELWxxDGT repeat protein
MMGGRIYFRANELAVGSELWSTDGTAAGTALFKDIWSGSSGSFPGGLFVHGTTLFFSANDGVNGTELWKSDGTPAGTVLVADLQPGSGGSSPWAVVAVNGKVILRASTQATGEEPFVTDGTAAGTQLLKDIAAGAGTSWSYGYVASGSRYVWFGAEDPAIGSEIYVTDGTPAGTKLVLDFVPGKLGSFPDWFVLSSGKLLFAADDDIKGSELWSLDPGAASKKVGIAFGAQGRMPQHAVTDPVVGGAMQLGVQDALPALGGALMVSLRGTPIAIGAGATLYIDPASWFVLTSFTTDAQGRWSMTLPLDPIFGMLQGVTIASQAVVGPTNSALGADATNGAHWTFGN